MDKKKVIKIATASTLITMAMTSMAGAATISNGKNFSDIKLPHGYSNITLSSAKKASSENHGVVRFSSSDSKDVGVWFRSDDNGWHYYTEKANTTSKKFYVTIAKTGVDYVVHYCDKDSKYYQKGTSVELRAENRIDTTFVKDKVSGICYFN